MKVQLQVPNFDQKDNIVGYDRYQPNGDWRLESQ